MSEHQEQCAFFEALKLYEGRYPELKYVHAIPNGGYRHIATAKKMAAEGVLAGVWDIYIPIPKGGYMGMYIEMKHGKNKLTDSQAEFGKFVASKGYMTQVCYTWEKALDALSGYLAIDMVRRALDA